MSAVPNVRQAPGSRRWAISEVTFEVKALWNITIFRGRFGQVDGYYETTPSGAQMAFTGDARSIDTGDRARDEQLRSASGVDWEAHPEVRFTSTSVRRAGDGKLHVEGRLDAAGRVTPVSFDAGLREQADGVELTGSWKVDERMLGRHLPLSVPATIHVRMHLRAE
jgi:polyisoprenoid-binding protein YceI